MTASVFPIVCGTFVIKWPTARSLLDQRGGEHLYSPPVIARAFTGLDQAEFEKLLTLFTVAYHAYMYDHHVTKKVRKRRYGGGRKPCLAAMEDKLFFILFYCKVYPLQDVMALLFETSQGRVNEWIHTLSTVLQMARGTAQAWPERNPKNLEQTLGDFSK